jgi:glycosyltransferase involved in cell wall biosynthesis
MPIDRTASTTVSDRNGVVAMSEVAIIIAAHNEERFIERALRSCLDQSLTRSLYSIVLVDDGSDDATLRIAQQYEPDVAVVVNDAQIGLPASINRGVRHAKSRFVVRVDADDYVHTDFLRVLYLYLDSNTYMDAVACDYYLVDEHEAHVERRNCLEHPIGCGIMFRKERLVAIGLYDESFLMAEDLDLRLRFEEHWPVHRVELPLYRYRLHGENMTRDRGEYDAFIERAKDKNQPTGQPDQ